MLVRPLLGLAAALLVAVLPFRATAADPYEINVIIPLTGPASFLGRAEQTSLGVVEGLANRDGGIGGRPVRFVIQDDQSNPQVAIQLLNGVIAKGVPIVMGSTLDALCRAMAAIVRAGGPLHYCFSNAFHPDEGSWSYSSSFSTLESDATAFRFAVTNGWKKIAYITTTDATGQDFEVLVDTVLARPENRGAQIVAREHFAGSDISVAAQMSRIKAANPQVLFVWTTGTPAGTAFRGIADAGIELPVITSSGNETYAQVKAYESFLPKQLYFSGIPSLTPGQLPRGPVRTAIERYQEAFKPTGVRPDIGANQPWDAALLVIDALRKIGPSATAAQLREALAHVRGWNGINGSYDFAALPNRGVGGNYTIVQSWDSAANAFVGMSRIGGAAR